MKFPFKYLYYFFLLFQSAASAQTTPDSTDEFYYYLPSNYSPAKKYPLLIYLDPAARKLSLPMYTVPGDSLGIIIASSRKSKNFDPAASFHSISIIYNDLTKKGYVDTSFVFLAGFSGGARAAVSYSQDHPEIKGLICCGAGLPFQGNMQTIREVPLAGIAGVKDMNFEEMISLHEELDGMKRENLLLLFNGGHQWPSAELLSTAAGWLLQHLKKNTENKFSCKPIQPVLQFKDSGWLYPSWILANQLRKLSSFSLFADSLAGGSETFFTAHIKPPVAVQVLAFENGPFHVRYILPVKIITSPYFVAA